MTPSDRIALYKIRLQGQLDARWLATYDDVKIYELANDQTQISGKFDQSGLFGILNRIRDLGLDLIEVRRVESDTIKDLP